MEWSVRQVPVTIVAFLKSAEDRRELRNIINHSNWTLQFIEGLQQGLPVIRQESIGVVISDASLADGHAWTDLLREFEDILAPPSLIVSDRLADDRLWAEVLSLGGYDLLVTPFDRDEVSRIVSLAWMAWKRRVDGSVRIRKAPTSADPPAAIELAASA